MKVAKVLITTIAYLSIYILKSKGGHVVLKSESPQVYFCCAAMQILGLQKRSLRFKHLDATFNSKFYFSRLFSFSSFCILHDT